MSGYSLAIQQSVVQRYLIIALAVAVVLLYSVTPLSPGWRLLSIPVLFCLFWYLLQAFNAPAVASTVMLYEQDRIRWLNSKLMPGVIVKGGLVSQYLILICWQADDGRICRQWLFADQLSKAGFRTLARNINQSNWLTEQKQ